MKFIIILNNIQQKTRYQKTDNGLNLNYEF